MVLEVLLNLPHLLGCSVFGVFLHAGIKGCIYLQTTGVEVVTISFAPVFEVIGYRLPKIIGLSVVVGFNVIL